MAKDAIRAVFGAIVLSVSWPFGPAQGQIADIGQFGVWTAYAGRISSGKDVCGLRTSGQQRSFHIKYFSGNQHWTIHLFKNDWHIDKEMPVRIRIELGSGYRSADWGGKALPGQGQSPAVVEVLVATEGSQEFWSAFRQANEGRLTFVTGNEGTWRVSLTGSNAAAAAMVSCIRNMGRTRVPFDSSPSRPFDSTPTRPSDPSPSRPFDTTPLPGFFDG